MIIILVAALIVGSILYINRKNLDYRKILLTIIIIWLIYSFIGIISLNEYKKSNGNVCHGYKYGLKICGGDINAE